MSKINLRGRQSRIITRMTLTALSVAISVVLCRLLGFSPGDSMFRIEIGFLPIALLGAMAGPLWAGLAYGMADLIGALIFTGVNPLILLCKVLTGMIMGLLFWGCRTGLVRSIIAFLIIGVWVDILAMSGVFTIYGFAPSFSVALGVRAINAAVNFPVRFLLYYLIAHHSKALLAKYARCFRQEPKERRESNV